MFAELVAHVIEHGRRCWLHVEAFLQESEPHVAAAVFGDGLHFAFGQIHLAAEVGVVGNRARLRVVYAQSLAVVAEHELALAVEIERRDGLVAGAFYGLELFALQA